VDEWLALFAPDAVVEDPVGPSLFDPDGKGHRRPAAIAGVLDTTVATRALEFTVRDSFAAGAKVANVGAPSTTHLPRGQNSTTDGVSIYRIGPIGLLRSLRAHWEFGPRHGHPPANQRSP